MQSEWIEAGKIVNTHGVQGEVKIVPWADSAKFLAKFKRFFIDGKEFHVLSSRCHDNNLIVRFEEVTDMNSALRLKDRVITISRSDAALPKDTCFIADLIGAAVLDESGSKVGILSDVLTYPASNIYVVKKENGEESLVPAVDEFIKKTDLTAGTVTIHFIEGM